MFDHWLIDDRLRYGLVVSPQQPAKAAQEIRDRGKDPRVAAVFVALTTLRMGNPHWFPIYEAALELGLPVATHPGTGEGDYQGAPTYGGSPPELFAERYADVYTVAIPQITSLVMNGVFERYPQLQVLFVEFGFSWVPQHLWRLDKTWREMRVEVPWVRKWPREYVHDHVKFTSQPIPEPADPRELDEMIQRYLVDTLCYSSDYPHWDGDRPGTVLRSLPEETQRKVLSGNADGILRQR
jgi:predicted TIM-barrel fold metal-dependent hydrolase